MYRSNVTVRASIAILPVVQSIRTYISVSIDNEDSMLYSAVLERNDTKTSTTLEEYCILYLISYLNRVQLGACSKSKRYHQRQPASNQLSFALAFVALPWTL
jgi:hypothetical protein